MKNPEDSGKSSRRCASNQAQARQKTNWADPTDDAMQCEVSDRKLVGRLARDESGALEEVIALYEVELRTLVGRLLAWDAETADVLQEVFLTAWRQAGRFRGEARLSTWLRTIAINECRRRRRWWAVRRKHQAKVAALVTHGECSPVDAESIGEETALEVRQAVARLPHAFREVVVLHYLEGRSTEEIATELQLRHNTVEVRLHRARGKLKLLLGSFQF